MTFGYRSDNLALRSVINKDFKYLGVLGSQTKWMNFLKNGKRWIEFETARENSFTNRSFNKKSDTDGNCCEYCGEIIKIKNA